MSRYSICKICKWCWNSRKPFLLQRTAWKKQRQDIFKVSWTKDSSWRNWVGICIVSVHPMTDLMKHFTSCKIMSQRTAFFTDRCWYSWKWRFFNMWMMVQKWLTLLNNGCSLGNAIKTLQKPGKELRTLLLPTAICWFSSRRILTRMFELKGKLQMLLSVLKMKNAYKNLSAQHTFFII